MMILYPIACIIAAIILAVLSMILDRFIPDEDMYQGIDKRERKRK